MVHLDYQLKMTQDERWNMLRRNHESTEHSFAGITDPGIHGITEARSADVRIYGDTELRRYGITDTRSVD